MCCVLNPLKTLKSMFRSFSLQKPLLWSHEIRLWGYPRDPHAVLSHSAGLLEAQSRSAWKCRLSQKHTHRTHWIVWKVQRSFDNRRVSVLIIPIPGQADTHSLGGSYTPRKGSQAHACSDLHSTFRTYFIAHLSDSRTPIPHSQPEESKERAQMTTFLHC